MPERSGHRPGVPCWVELSSTDVALSVGFYRELFGWDAMFDAEPESGGYGRFTKNGRLVAGITPSLGPGAPAAWNTYVAVDDAADTMARVRAAGGEVVLEPVAIRERGVTAAFQDPLGAFLAVWQPGEDHGAELVSEPGAFAWCELSCRDTVIARSFYQAVFGWEARDAGVAGMEYTEWRAQGSRAAGMVPMGPDVPAEVPSHWRTYFAVADADATVAKVRELGGRIFTEPVMTPAGAVAVMADPEFAIFAVVVLDWERIP
ncbi:VOC family protein [Planomonospora sp. ID67723]|uniref:VOC family protein n=1 Tax=Planomonospora sp. ID67723 TaxID=2738134 RepID=UPI0018C35E3C|nr:VOC family protein [Planomonospora sp. ID67723]MBG0832904.1 VOC family protein [Planomonospora sp. ID67723]